MVFKVDPYLAGITGNESTDSTSSSSACTVSNAEDQDDLTDIPAPVADAWDEDSSALFTWTKTLPCESGNQSVISDMKREDMGYWSKERNTFADKDPHAESESRNYHNYPAILSQFEDGSMSTDIYTEIDIGTDSSNSDTKDRGISSPSIQSENSERLNNISTTIYRYKGSKSLYEHRERHWGNRKRTRSAIVDMPARPMYDSTSKLTFTF